jgi:hypothetical protein
MEEVYPVPLCLYRWRGLLQQGKPVMGAIHWGLLQSTPLAAQQIRVLVHVRGYAQQDQGLQP